MNTNLFYFSATGNTLMVCKELQKKLTDCSMEPMAKLVNQTEIIPDSRIVGFVFPLYFAGLPNIVASFISKVNFQKIDYIFAVVTKSQFKSPGLVEEQMNKILVQYNKKVNFVTYINMVGNFIMKYDIISAEKQRAIMEQTLKKVDFIAGQILKKDNKIENPARLLKFIGRQMYIKMRSNAQKNDDGFFCDTCNQCGLCVQICPAGNITLSSERPVWNHNCELCLACIHACPLKGIQYGKETQAQLRYRNPDITIEELLVR